MMVYATLSYDLVVLTHWNHRIQATGLHHRGKYRIQNAHPLIREHRDGRLRMYERLCTISKINILDISILLGGVSKY